MKWVQYYEYSISTFINNGLVLKRQNISSHSAEYSPICLQRFIYVILCNAFI